MVELGGLVEFPVVELTGADYNDIYRGYDLVSLFFWKTYLLTDGLHKAVSVLLL